MELAKIEQLLKKYEAAETSLQEEQVLKTYFKQNEVPEHLEEYKIMFNYFSNNIKDVSTKSIKLPKSHVQQNRWYAIAAAVVLFISIIGLYQKNSYEQKQAQIAFKETQKALDLIAFQLNKGNDAIAHLDKLEVTQNKIFK